MTAKHKLRAFTLPATTFLAIAFLVIVVVLGATSSALAFCSSCGVPAATYSAGYAAPVAYSAGYVPATYTTAYAPAYTTAYAPAYTTAYAPAYTTAYAPAYDSGWYPGRFVGRVNRAIWGYPTTTYYAPTYTAAYAPTYTAAYATTAYYAAPACSTCAASYAQPACSACSAGYAPAPCSTCSACSASYAPACSTCGTCDACTAAAPACPNCTASTVAPATYTEAVAPPPVTTYGTTSTSAAPTNEPQPTIDPNLNLPAERSELKTQKPEVPEAATQPEPQPGPADDSATNLQAPKLFDPNDRTAQRHMAPVWTAEYHKVGGARPTAQPISLQQVERDAEGWTSASE